jgi:hypothetical protein
MGGPWRFCRKCGGELRPGVQFCTACGHTAGLSSGPATQVSEGSGAGSGGESGSAATVTSPAVTGRESRYRPWPGAPAGGQGSFPDPDDEPSPGRRPVRSRLLVLGAIAVLVAGLAAGVVVVAHPFGQRASPRSAPTSSPAPAAAVTSPSPASSPPGSSSPPLSSAEQAAGSLAALLARSVTDRAGVDAAYNDVKGCGPHLTRDVRTFKYAAASRGQLLGQLATMPGRSALSQPMLGDLGSAWQASVAADDDFAAWAQDQVSGGCSPDNQTDPHFLAADGPDLQATAGKKAFIRLWNPVAQTYGLTTYRQNEL